MIDRKPTLSCDFDGVLHLYSSGWKGPDKIPDGPVPGAMQWLRQAIDHFNVSIFSSRSRYPQGIAAMKKAIEQWATEELGADEATVLINNLEYPTHKPAAFISIDNRAFCFEGEFPNVHTLLKFKPWNKR